MTTAGERSTWQPWRYAYTAGWTGDLDLVGFGVEAVDGPIGKIDEASDEVGSSYLVVDTGPWIFGRRVMLPAGTVARIDVENRRVYVDRTKDEIKDSPAFDESGYLKRQYRDELGDYYSRR